MRRYVWLFALTVPIHLAVSQPDHEYDYFVKEHIRVGAGFQYALHEYTPSVALTLRWTGYMAELNFPVTMVDRRPSGRNKLAVSFTSLLLPAGILGTYVAAHMQTYLAVFVGTFTGIFVVGNSRHYLVLTGPKGLVKTDGAALALFVGAQSDVYNFHGWGQAQFMGGAQIGLPLDADYRKTVEFQLGLTKPREFTRDWIRWQPLKLFAGVRYVIAP